MSSSSRVKRVAKFKINQSSPSFPFVKTPKKCTPALSSGPHRNFIQRIIVGGGTILHREAMADDAMGYS